MRLLDSKTLEFKEFNESCLPRYAILSHTWGDDEVSYEDMLWLQKLKDVPAELRSNQLYSFIRGTGGGVGFPNTPEAITKRAGYAKIRHTAKLANSLHIQYFWIDTCCIKKESSAELQEAINSMYRWYQKSAICIVFLADAGPIPDDTKPVEYLDYALRDSRWITRGWTLQELIAPHLVSFYDRDWNLICDKRDNLRAISLVTGIPPKVLRDQDLSDSSVAQRMSWAANRSTTRIEDIAYSLMGLFDIHMPMLYGEGDKAFTRLQVKIMKATGDDSIFAWKNPDAGASTFSGLLARSPRDFMYCTDIHRGKPLAMSNTNLGIRLELSMEPLPRNKECYVALLQAKNNEKRHVGIILRRINSDNQKSFIANAQSLILGESRPWKINPDEQFTRVSAESLLLGGSSYPNNKVAVYVRQSPYIPQDFVIDTMHGFHLRIVQDHLGPQFLILQAWPHRQWNPQRTELLISDYQTEFIGIIWLDVSANAIRARIVGPGVRFCVIKISVGQI
ncbi:hypothetical protein N0V90_004008 [Kalmusia sp. IMI 367209]|nr:hypothetical protein N0V90_004008 [Kalmusia sp. IMI 367209]